MNKLIDIVQLWDMD